MIKHPNLTPQNLTPNLTPNEMKVLSFIKDHIEQKGFSPSFIEIKDYFGFKSNFSVQQYIKQLTDKGALTAHGDNKKRALEVVKKENNTIPLLGRVAAGLPIEAVGRHEEINVLPSMLGAGGDFFALQVKGDSMVGDGIFEDDIVVIKKQSVATNGQTVVALINNEATIKRFVKKKDHVELHAANPAYQPIIVKAHEDFKIEGILHGLIRAFKR